MRESIAGLLTGLLLFASAPFAAAVAVDEDAPAPADSAAAAVKWDVADPPSDGAAGGWGWHEAPLDVDTGTWMSVDVSPDGATIVFDLLGDIYAMPVTGSADGSQVRCLSPGLQWDMQPRFSPDGKWIAFVSDRTGEGGKGGDNIWVMRADGSEARQVTKETFRLVTQPAWTPDSQYIVARKHFTGRRSLGAGEMWLYHASGATDGVQLTAKQGDQKDTGEPAVSPDGRYLYYSLDATPGANFEYDKDANAGIYAIDRLDLRTQQTERLIAGPGGACRPVPSPDGSSVAFVRRVRHVSTLFVYDLRSGRARAVYAPLERDNQETWAVHGVYPAMAWTPDGRSLVFWAKGKIRRVDVADGRSAEIPFRVRDGRRIAEAVRFDVAVAPADFEARMIQHATVSPQGDRVVFQALGHLWVAPFTEGGVGEPRRLTRATDEFEYYPAWSPDGRQLAYVAWNDRRLAAVRIIAAGGGEPRAVTTEPGHYLNPAFSPDGRTLVWEKTGGGYLTSPLWGQEQGVYAAPAGAGGGRASAAAPRRIATRGGQPHFGAGSDRVFLVVRDGAADSDKVSLASVPVQGSTPDDGERTHFTSDWATEMRVSPDGRWVAFAERYNVYAVPFVDAGKPVAVAPRGAGVPIVKLSREAGNFLHWSGDSRALRWSLGPHLSTLPVGEALAASAFGGAAKDAPAATPVTATIHLGAQADLPRRADGSESVIALTNVKVLTMENIGGADGARDGQTRGLEVIERGTVLVRGNRIAAVGPADRVAIPAGATVIDGKGGVVTPGLVDVHAHGGQGENGFTPQDNWSAQANLAFGVTTIHDPSNDTEQVFAASELQRSGLVTAPRIFSTGTILYGAQGAYKAEIESLDDALFHLGRMKAVGAFSVKSYNQPRRDQRQMVLEAARRLGMMVVPEGGALFQHNLTMVVDGHTTVEHTLPVASVYDDVAQLWGRSAVGYTPTLVVAYGGLGGENYWYARTQVWANERLLRFVPRYVVDPRSRRTFDAPDEEWNHFEESRLARKVLDAKQQGIVAETGRASGPGLGAHGQLAGIGPHWELWMLAQGGLTPHEALRAATIDGASQLGLDGDIGSLRAGKLADLLLFSGDPTVDIRRSESLAMVMLNGRLYDAASLAQLAPVAKPGPTYFFEELQAGAGTPLAVEAIMRKAAENGATCAGCGHRH